MEALKKEIKKILEKYQKNEIIGTGIARKTIIYELYFNEIVNDISKIIQIVFDPENQPNQLGIENPFYRFCMPDEVIDKESHEQYLKDIGIIK